MSTCPELTKERFLSELRNNRVDELLDPKNRDFLRKLRYNMDTVSQTLRCLGRTLRARDIDLHKLILEASGDWDEEDDEKYGDCPAAAYYQKNTRPGITKVPIGDDDVVAARQEYICCRQEEELRIQVLHSAERRRRDVEKEEIGSGFLFRVGSAQEETPPQEKGCKGCR